MTRTFFSDHPFAWLVLLAMGLATVATTPVQAQQAPQISYTANGQVVLENALIKTRLSSKTGQNEGFLGWLFKPTNTQQIDVLYGQTDYLTGHVFGEKWDPVEKTGFIATTPQVGKLLPPTRVARSKDGAALLLEQSSSDSSRFNRQVIIRRDLTTLEVTFKLTNLSAQPYAASLRLHTIWSPAATNEYQNRNDFINLMTEEGLISLDQSLTRYEFDAKYKGSKYFNQSWDTEPARWWVRGKQPTPTLTENWAAQFGQVPGTNTAQGMVMLLDNDQLVGYYNDLAATLEPVARSFALRQDDSWEASGFLASYAGLEDFKNQPIIHATSLYVATQLISADNGNLRGRLVPMFQGKLQGVDSKGKTFFATDASPTRAMTLDAKLPKGDWHLEALDTQGKRIGVINAQGQATLDEVTFVDQTPKPPAVTTLVRNVVAPKNIRSEIEAFLKPRDFVIYCDFHADDALKALAQKMARQLGVGITQTSPQGKAIILGDPTNSDVVKQIGQFNHDISTQWPGAGKGVLLTYNQLQSTQQPALLVAGSDKAASQLAARTFTEMFLKDVKAPAGFALWPATVADQIQPYTPAALAQPGPIHLQMARGEYEPAQIVLTAYEDLTDIEVTVAPLINDKTGKPISGRYLTSYRSVRAPLWLRWVRQYPLEPADGWAGTPDPLTDYPVKDLPAGQSQALWLTVITPQTAEPGMYSTSLTVLVAGKQLTVPIHVKVLDFTLPDTGLMGEPYMNFPAFAPDGRPELKPNMVKELTQNLVEHGMRVISLDGQDIVRWRFSPEGAFKGKDLPWLTVSEDGKVAMDTSAMDQLIDQVDAAAKPFEIFYRLAIHKLVNYPYGISDFRRALPDRFADQPERKGHPYISYQAQEMMSMLRQHLVKRDMLDRFVLKIGDEPRSFQWWWESFTIAAREAKIPFATCFNSVSWDEVKPAMGTSMRWIQPLYMHYDKDFFESARESGMIIGWYNCGPPPRNSVGTSAMELRSYVWQAAKADLDIIAWWGVQNWNYGGHHDLWHNRHSHWNSLIYPQHPAIKPWREKGWLRDAAPLDSIRWEHIRDGMEDAACVLLLRKNIAQARKDKRTEAADKAQAVLDKVWHDVFPALVSYRPTWEELQNVRQQVAQAIVDLNQANDVASSKK